MKRDTKAIIQLTKEQLKENYFLMTDDIETIRQMSICTNEQDTLYLAICNAYFLGFHSGQEHQKGGD